MYVKEMKNYTEYYNYQNDRSGLGHNQNKVIDDLYMLKEIGLSLEDYKNQEFYILDIGCRAKAHTVEQLHNLGYHNTYGVDIGGKAEEQWVYSNVSSFLKKHDIHKGNPFDFKFHMVTISHTLEHLYDPDKVAQVIYDLLEDNGLIYTIIPFQTKEELFNHGPHYVSFENHKSHINFWEKHNFKNISGKTVDMNNTQAIPGESRLWLQKQ
jgi:2-polyprenyl-3-methyl-5-hydroxy-6-metoxy-1,4-benzoquinol methylase